MFVQRDQTGRVKGCYAVRQPGIADEELADNAPEVLAFRANPFPAKTPTEIEDDCRREIDNGRLNRLLFEINFDQESRLSDLEGRPAVSRAQYRDALIAIYRNLP